MIWKLAQLAALPLALLVVALTTTPRHPQGRRPVTFGPRPAADEDEPRPPAAFFAGRAAPAAPLDLATVSAPSAPSRGGWFQVTVVADLPDAATAAVVAGEVTTLLGESARHLEDPAHGEARARLLDEASPAPLTPAESVAFERAGVASPVGIGWPGARAEVRDAVLVLGRVVLVPGLKGDFSRLQKNPLAALLAARGARVFAEGDPGSATSPRVDVSCAAPSADAAARVVAALRDYLQAPATFTLRPPWHPSGVSATEARARASYARLARALRDVTAAVTEEFARTFNPYTLPDDPEALAHELMRLTRERGLAAIDDAARDGTHDPVVVEVLRRSVAASGDFVFDLEVHDPAARRRLAERMGALSAEVVAPATPGAGARLVPTAPELAYAARGAAQASDARVELGGFTFHRIGRGLPALLLWLRTSGCSDAKLAVVASDRSGGLGAEDE